MRDEDIIGRVEKGISFLIKNDSYLLLRDVSERSITHKLAEYLQQLFPEYNVDCEYNRNGDEPKSIKVLKSQLEGILTAKQLSKFHQELIERAVYPDIIIHHRGTNKDNKCIIEVKKSNSSDDTDYDEQKLIAYTGDENDNVLKYQIGIHLLFDIQNLEFTRRLYKDGEVIA